MTYAVESADCQRPPGRCGRAEGLLEKLRMAAEAHEMKLATLDPVDEQQIRGNMAFSVRLPLPFERMVLMLWRDAKLGNE